MNLLTPYCLRICLLVGLAFGCSSSDNPQGEAAADVGQGSDPSDAMSADMMPLMDAAEFGQDVAQGLDAQDAAVDSELVEEDVQARCDLGTQRCASDRIAEYCARGYWEQERCEPPFVCVEGQGCRRQNCEPGEQTGCASRTELAVCDETGTDVIFVPCEEGLSCRNTAAGFQCTDTICDAGNQRCLDDRQLEICREDGLGWDPGERCSDIEECSESQCQTLCELNNKVSSFLGCEYWSVDLDNVEGGQVEPHAVVISNPTSLAANVTIYDPSNQAMTVLEWPTTVPAGELATWVFDPDYINTATGDAVIDPGLVDRTTIVRAGFRVETDVPVTMHQFNPLVGGEVYTNDASLMFPENALGDTYLAMSWKHRFTGNSLRGFVAILAVDDQPTTVQVVPTADVLDGVDRVRPDDVPERDMTRLSAGLLREYVLLKGEVLNLETAGPAEEDLTGSLIVADRPIAVFGGHECGNVQLGIDRCDHIETQLTPLSTWGTYHVATKFSPRGEEPDIVRVLASVDGTRLATSPELSGVHEAVLNRGEFLEFELYEHAVIQSTSPVSVGHYMVGANWSTIPLVCNTDGRPTGIGDPALTVLPPQGQFRDSYIFLTPVGYDENYLNIFKPSGAMVVLDGELVSPDNFVTVEGTGFQVAVLSLEPGAHKVTSERQFGVEVYGYGCRVSYAYPGGMNLTAINR